jgi:hypothetical protein
VLAFALTVRTLQSFDVGVVTQLQQGANRSIRPQHDASAISPIATIGTTARLVRLAVESYGSVPTRAGEEVDGDFIYECH